MPNTYTQLYTHIVFAVQHREALIQEPVREPLQRYLSGIASHEGRKHLAVYCMPDHTHLLIGWNLL